MWGEDKTNTALFIHPTMETNAGVSVLIVHYCSFQQSRKSARLKSVHYTTLLHILHFNEHHNRLTRHHKALIFKWSTDPLTLVKHYLLMFWLRITETGGNVWVALRNATGFINHSPTDEIFLKIPPFHSKYLLGPLVRKPISSLFFQVLFIYTDF